MFCVRAYVCAADSFHDVSDFGSAHAILEGTGPKITLDSLAEVDSMNRQIRY